MARFSVASLPRPSQRSLLVLSLGTLLFFVGCAARSYQRSGDMAGNVSWMAWASPWGSRNLTVQQLLERGAKGKLGTSVKLQGRVVRRSPLLDGVVYQIQDRTGDIWVRSSDNDLQVGQIWTVQGKPIYESVIIEGIDFGAFYLQEQRRILANAS